MIVRIVNVLLVSKLTTKYLLCFLGDSTQLDLDGLLYIGGVGAPFAPLTVPPVLWTGALRQGYVGCLRDLVINSQSIDIAGYAQQQDSGKSRSKFHTKNTKFTVG